MPLGLNRHRLDRVISHRQGPMVTFTPYCTAMVQGTAKAATYLVPNAFKGMREMLLIRFAGHCADPDIFVAATSAFDNALKRAVAGKRARSPRGSCQER